jgi:hypothetical protein
VAALSFSGLPSVSNTNIPLQIASLFECHYVFPLFSNLQPRNKHVQESVPEDMGELFC